jgi:ribonuclease G
MKPARCFAHRAIRLTEIWRDDAPGERRAALVEGGKIVEIHIQRDLHLALGDCGVGHIDRKTPSGAYIVTDDGPELLVRRNVALPEGTRVAFEITREAIAEPGRAKPAECKVLDLLPEPLPDSDALWASRIGDLDAGAEKDHPLSDPFDCALAGASQQGNVTVSFQRTKAGLVFDVDGIGDPLDINVVAAKEIARLLRLYQVGAMVMIDFVAVDAKAKRIEIAEAFDAAAAGDRRPFERSAINGYGLMQVVRSRPRPSVLDQLFGTRIASPSDETQALWLLREVARSTGFGARIVTARPEVATLLTSTKWQPLRAQSERLSGAKMEVVADEHASDYGHVHVAQS